MLSLKAAAPIGAAFTFLALLTGSLWGKPMWGTWWVWDARLTSVFILFLMYLGVIALSRALDDPAKSARAVAILVLVGFINIPIIKFSVDWWNTLHQPAAVFRMDGPTIHSSLLLPLLISAIGFTLLFFALHMAAMQNEIWNRRIIAMRRHCRPSARARRMNHTAFIAASYGASAFVLGALALLIIAARIKAKRELAALDAAGIKRRSDS